MTGTEAMHPALDRWLAGLDDPAVVESWLAWAAETGADVPAGGEQMAWEAERAAVAARAAEAFARFEATVPPRFRGAWLADFEERQGPGGEVIPAVVDRDGRPVAQTLDRFGKDLAAQNLILAGPPGRGKTRAAVTVAYLAAAAAAFRAEALPAVWSVAALLDALKPSPGNDPSLWQSVKAVPLLVLDDLAHTRPTEWAIERMWMLTDARSAAGLRTVVTTNAAWPGLVATWGTPTMDRIRDASVIVVLEGESLRKPAW